MRGEILVLLTIIAAKHGKVWRINIKYICHMNYALHRVTETIPSTHARCQRTLVLESLHYLAPLRLDLAELAGSSRMRLVIRLWRSVRAAFCKEYVNEYFRMFSQIEGSSLSFLTLEAWWKPSFTAHLKIDQLRGDPTCRDGTHDIATFHQNLYLQIFNLFQKSILIELGNLSIYGLLLTELK